jgi:hypothetical protein
MDNKPFLILDVPPLIGTDKRSYVADVVTLGGALTDKEEPYTANAVKG